MTIGKTNVPELGILPTTESHAYGAARNPWNLERTPGGSSGGAAAAVASGMVSIAHANDGGGSIRIPASHCGLVGLKPTRQRTSEGPLIGDAMSGMTVELVVARSVRDVAGVLDAVHGPAPGDPYVAPPPERPYLEELEAEPGRLRIGLVTSSAAGIEVDPAVVAAAKEAGELLESLGHSIDERQLADAAPGVGDELVGSFMVRWAAGQAALLATLSRVIGRPFTADDVEPLTWALAEDGRRRSAAEYLDAVGAAPARRPDDRHLARLRARPAADADRGRAAAAARRLRRLRARPDGGDPARLADGRLLGNLQRHRPARDLGAAALDRGRAPGRDPAGRRRSAPRAC